MSAGIRLVAGGELEQTKQPRTVRQIKQTAEALHRKLEQAVERAGASALYRIDVAAGVFGRFEICLVRRADDAVIARGGAGHDVAAAELYRIGGDVFRTGISAEISAILAESHTTKVGN